MNQAYLLFVALWAFGVSSGASAKSCPYGVYEKTLEQACSENLSYRGGSKYDCLAAGRDEYIDSCALGICVKYDSSREKTECVQAARGRIYSDDDIRDCMKRYDDGEGTECLAARGTSQARFQQLELAKEKGHRQGQAEAEKKTRTFDVAVPTQRGEKSGKTVGGLFVKQTAYNAGVAKGRAANAPLDAAAYKDGETEGSKIAAGHAAAFDRPSGFNAALVEKQTGAAAPELSETLSLQDDKTASLEGPGTLTVTRLVRTAVGPQPVGPKAAGVSTPSKQPPSDRDPSTYDMPYVGNERPSSLKSAPCVADDDTACIEAYKKGYAHGYTETVHTHYTKQYREAYQAAFDSSLKAVLAEAVPPEFEQQGVTFASRERGILDNYAVSYAGFKITEFEKGRADFAAALSKLPLVRLASIRLESAAGAMVVPTNGYQLTVDVDNFGEVDAVPGQFRVSLPVVDKPGSDKVNPDILYFQAKSWNKVARVLPKIPGRTRSTFRFALEGTAGRMATGKAHALTVAMDSIEQLTPKQMSYVTIQSLKTEIVPNYPVELVKLTPNTKFSGTQAVTARFTVKNNRNVKSDAVIGVLTTEPQAIAVKNADAVKIPELEPGESFEFDANLEPTVWTNYRGPTDFSLKLSNAQGALLARQLFPYVVDLGMPLGLRIVYNATDYSGKTIQQLQNYRSLPIQIQVDCSQKIDLHDGYRFRYAGSSNASFDFVGTVGADIGSCTPNRPRMVAHGSIWTPTTEVTTPAALRFVLEQNGAIVQGVQVFVQTVAGNARGGRGYYGGSCSTCF